VRIAAVVPTGHARYFHTDQVDSVHIVTNDTGGAVNRTEYLPFGETWFQEGEKAYAPKFNSQELDRESGLYFFNARHQDPELGRFETADTVIDGEYSTQGGNRYAYVHNNPVKYKDPTGHWTDPVDNPEIRSHQMGRRAPQTNLFGRVRSGGQQGHGGLDLRTADGESTYAVGDGEVVRVYNSRSLGTTVILKFKYQYTAGQRLADWFLGTDSSTIKMREKYHGKTLYAQYNHLRSADVEEGEKVSEGDVIGETGHSGNAARIPRNERHLHFSLHTKNPPGRGNRDLTDTKKRPNPWVDPAPFFIELDKEPKDNRRSRIRQHEARQRAERATGATDQ